MKSYFARTYLNYSKLLLVKQPTIPQLVYPSITQRRLLASPPFLSRSKNSALGVTPSWCMRAMDESNRPPLWYANRDSSENLNHSQAFSYLSKLSRIAMRLLLDCVSTANSKGSRPLGIEGETWGDQGLTIISLLHCQGGPGQKHVHRIIQLHVGFNISVGKKACSICIHMQTSPRTNSSG
jgi:hypothetical protein